MRTSGESIKNNRAFLNRFVFFDEGIDYFESPSQEICEQHFFVSRRGQGVVFHLISLWFLLGKLMRNAWLNPGRIKDGYYWEWFRSRTAKSLKVPCRFKGWKGKR